MSLDEILQSVLKLQEDESVRAGNGGLARHEKCILLGCVSPPPSLNGVTHKKGIRKGLRKWTEKGREVLEKVDAFEKN